MNEGEGSGGDDTGAPSACLLVLQEEDQGEDGTIDSVLHYDYEDRRLISLTTDLDADGRPDWRRSWTYDERGLVVVDETDSDADGDADYRYTFDYDDQEREILQTWDDDADGVPYSCLHTTWNEHDQYTRVVVDVACDGRPDVETTYSWCPEGSIRSTRLDRDGDGTVDETTRNACPTTHTTTNGAGQPVLQEYDGDSDGDIDARTTWTYDDAGRLLKMERDNGLDGDIDESIVATWNEDGSHEELHTMSLMADEGPERIVETRFDARGNPVYRLRIDDFTTYGGVRSVEEERWTWAPQGDVETWTRRLDDNGDDVPEQVAIVFYTYDC